MKALDVPRAKQATGQTLRILQAEVGGYIEAAGCIESRVRPGVTLAAWCNEEGHIKRLPPNRCVDGCMIVGDIVISASDDNTGETVSMDEPLVLEAIRWAKSWSIMIHRGSITKGGDA